MNGMDPISWELCTRFWMATDPWQHAHNLSSISCGSRVPLLVNHKACQILLIKSLAHLQAASLPAGLQNCSVNHIFMSYQRFCNILHRLDPVVTGMLTAISLF